MVIRHDAAGVLAIGQPAHAWLCGQMARAWGNERFGEVVPLDEVALGAEQHDVGWARADLAPAPDAQRGRPPSFIEVGPAGSAALWRDGPAQLATQSRYAALLATMHGRRLFERIDLDDRPADEAEEIRATLDALHDGEAALVAQLRDDPLAATGATAELLARNSALVWTWDTLSLALLLDWAPHTLQAVPAQGAGVVDVDLRAVASRDGLPTHALSPWPFADPDGVVLHTEGRRLADDGGLDGAPFETLRFALVPG